MQLFLTKDQAKMIKEALENEQAKEPNEEIEKVINRIIKCIELQKV